jgi:hypothetical protein
MGAIDMGQQHTINTCRHRGRVGGEEEYPIMNTPHFTQDPAAARQWWLSKAPNKLRFVDPRSCEGLETPN